MTPNPADIPVDAVPGRVAVLLEWLTGYPARIRDREATQVVEAFGPHDDAEGITCHRFSMLDTRTGERTFTTWLYGVFRYKGDPGPECGEVTRHGDWVVMCALWRGRPTVVETPYPLDID